MLSSATTSAALEMLLNAGDNVEGKPNLNLNVQDNSGKTVLHYAAKHRSVATLEKLLKVGLNVEGTSKLTLNLNAQDNSG